MSKKYGTIVVGLLLIVVGLAAIIWKQNLDSNNAFVPYLSEISSALLVGGVLSMLYKIFTEREQREELRLLFHIHKSVEEAGLDEVLAASQSFDFTEFLRRHKSVVVVLNDGERWIGNQAVALRERFSTEGFTTVVFTVDPDGAFTPVLASKVGKSTEEQRTKIHNAWNLLEEQWRESTKAGRAKLLKLKHYPTQSVFLGDTEAVVTLYQTSEGRTNVPVLIVKDVGRERSFFSFLKKDVANLQKEATDTGLFGGT